MAKAFLYGNGGGGAGLTFKVLDGTTQPIDAKDGAIWVNTDVKITAYDFSPTRTENPVEGMAWIKTGTTSPVAFNALKKNSLTVYPLSVQQYIGGAWVDKTAQSKQGDAWVDWFTGVYLYNNGDQCEGETGGWTYTKTCGGSIDLGGEAISIECAGVSGKDTYFAVYTTKRIDISDYTELVFNEGWLNSITGDGVAKLYAGLFSTVPNSLASVSGGVKCLTPEGGAVLDVSGMTGSYYVCIAGGFYGSPDYTVSARVTEIYKN